MKRKWMIMLAVLFGMAASGIAAQQSLSAQLSQGCLPGGFGMPVNSGGKIFVGGRQVYPIAWPGYYVIQGAGQTAQPTSMVGVQAQPTAQVTATQGQGFNLGSGQTLIHAGWGNTFGSQVVGVGQNQGIVSPGGGAWQSQGGFISQVGNVAGGPGSVGLVQQNAFVNAGQFQQY